MKSLWSKFCLALGAVLLTGLGAQAQTSSYQPSVLPSESIALRMYQSLPTKVFKGSSGCFQRAHNWSFQLSQRYNINSMKVFLFFTHRYQREFGYEWWYHVAPMIPVRTSTGAIEEMVFDPTFVTAPSWATGSERLKYDNKPISIQQWTRYFISPNVECPVVENYADFEKYQERYYCYIMKAPMFTYIPANMEAQENRTTWNKLDLEQMKKAYKLEYRIQ